MKMMKSIRELAQVGVWMLISMFLITSCSDKDDVPDLPPGEKQIQQVLKELDKVEGVNEFVQALTKASSTIGNMQEEKLTVFAAKNFVATRAAGDETLKRHIAKGATDIKSFSGDTLKLQTLSGEELYVTKTDDGKVLVNGIPLAQDNRLSAGESYIYIVSETLPTKEIFFKPKYEIKFTVLEYNTGWSVENNATTFPSDAALITLYKQTNDKYTPIDSARTDSKGYASIKHSYTGELYYTVSNGNWVTNYGGYKPVGIFISQAEIDANRIAYKTNSSLDELKPGSVKLADLNGDGVINSDDKLDSEYFMVDWNDEVAVYLTPPVSSSITEEGFFQTVDDVRKAVAGLSTIYQGFVTAHYMVERRLMNGSVAYPQLKNLTEITAMWQAGYRYIQTYLRMRKEIDVPSNRTELLDEWNKHYSDSEFSYIYSILVARFGGVPLIVKPSTELLLDIQRSTPTEVMEYVESLVNGVSAHNKYAIKTLLARYYANEKDYTKTLFYANEVINSGAYTLVSKPFATVSNKEVILGGYTLGTDDVISHTIRYREVILLAAEAALKLGNQQEALQYVNQIQQVNNLQAYTDVSDHIIHALWNAEFANEGMIYLLLNRWGTLLDVLGVYGAQDFNNVLPIPRDEIAKNPYMTQNPGYN